MAICSVCSMTSGLQSAPRMPNTPLEPTAERMALSEAPIDTSSKRLLNVLLDSWDRSNDILVNLLRALPEGGLEARAMESSPSVGQMFSHIHYVRLVLVLEDAPELATPLPDGE